MVDIKSVPISLARRAGDFLFLSGQVALDDTGVVSAVGIAAQTRQVLARIEKVLRDNDAALDDVVTATVWIANADDFAEFNAAYAEYFPSLPPARSTVVSGLLVGALIEIAVTAYVPKSGA